MRRAVPQPRRVLVIIVLAQFAGTSLWFAGNAVMADVGQHFNLTGHHPGHLTSAVQLGFIAGTLVFAVLNIADRFSPSKIFFLAALAGAVANLGILSAGSFSAVLGWRVLTGFCLAGIYPVGMKIAADYHQQGLGKALGWLVGALVLGTALPHLLKGITQALPWALVFKVTSGLAVAGGWLVYWLVPDGPYLVRRPTAFKLGAFMQVFYHPPLRRAAFGYFGHMWELYTFWAFIPVILATYLAQHPYLNVNVSLLAFGVICVGAGACILGGYLSFRVGSHRIAFGSLCLSGVCCLLSPLAFMAPLSIFVAFLVIWGMAVVADSPQFSTLVAQSAPATIKGTALTLVNSVGFFITVISIQVTSYLSQFWPPQYLYLVLALGPLLGLISLGPGNRS